MIMESVIDKQMPRKNIWLEKSHSMSVCVCVLYTEYQKTQSSEDIFESEDILASEDCLKVKTWFYS